MASLKILAGDEENGDSQCIFVFEEGHTLGNALRSIIIRYPDVEFCGYSVPHPGENKMHLRIQAKGQTRAIDVLRRGLQDLEKLCDHTIETFQQEVANFHSS